MSYTPKTEFFRHQYEVFEKTKDFNAYALFWEMGCGKTKPTIDTAAYLYSTGKIDGLLVLAPNGVHRNWLSDELPAHMPDFVAWYGVCYHSARARQNKQLRELANMFEYDGLAVLIMSYDAFITEAGRDTAKRFLLGRNCMFVCDESTKIKTPGAKRTKVLMTASRLAPYRRILTGTPVANSPFDVYSQIRFLDNDFWKRLGMDSFIVFKNYFAIFQRISAGASGRGWDKLVSYRNLEQLQSWLRSISSRVTKDEVLDLPPKVYTKRYFELSAPQIKAYAELKTQFITWLDSGEEVTAALALVRLTRFHQITCGYLPVDETGEVLKPLGPENPRLDCLRETLEDVTTQAIIWARFRHDIDLICEMLGPDAVRYDGSTSQRDREDAIDRFKAGKVQFFVANPAAIGMGVTLLGAKTVIYYTNSFNLTDRLQSEDRPHRLGQTSSIHYIDIVAEGTVDEHIVNRLRSKLDIASQVTGDNLREWI